MARLARFVHPGLPYHVTHRGNRRQPIFMADADWLVYRELLAEYAAKAGLSIWGYCLMTNHVHLLVVPSKPDSLARGVGLAHRRFAQRQNSAHKWTGHLFEGRFFSAALDNHHLWTCIRYIERNPVRAAMAARAAEWPWSSTRSHAAGERDPLLTPGGPFPGHLSGYGEWERWLALPEGEEAELALRLATRTGRPCGSKEWVQALEAQSRRRLAALPVGRPRSGPGDDQTADLFADGG